MIRKGNSHKNNCKKWFKTIVPVLLFVSCQLVAQSVSRPLIWLKNSDKPAILKRIDRQSDINQYHKEFIDRVEPDLKAYQADKKAYLMNLPLDWKNRAQGEFPPFQTLTDFGGNKKREYLMHYLQTAVDCGVLYYLTDEKKYAAYAADVLYTFTQALLQLKPSTNLTNGGWLYPDDHLREAREIGAQLPIIYDFVQPYLLQKKQVYDLNKKTLVDFNLTDTQTVFKTYINLALQHGIINCNWPVLESPSLVGNILALDDPEERTDLLKYFLVENTPRQDALQKVSKHYLDYNGNWPESLNYSNAVNGYLTYLITLLTKYEPSLHLGLKHQHILKALPQNYYMTYPNKTETLLFGDGHRAYNPNFPGFEMAYYLSHLEGASELKNIFGSLINSSIANGSYKRFKLPKRSYSATYYKEPLKLLWYQSEIKGEAKDYPLPTTDELPFAGIVLQRNLSDTGDPKDALMGFVGGGHYVHGHATGMSMELYGKGYVLGSKSGRSRYRTEIHENYYRLFASNNTVVVNGESQSEGGWVSLKINQVQKVAMEPEPNEPGVSPNHSFSTSGFIDDKGELAEALQERTLGIIRTSPTTGYYIDVFRSRSKLPDQYHDYIYHNIGDKLDLLKGKKSIKLRSEPDRYKASMNKEWTKNKKARHPGWHYFKEVRTSGDYQDALTALFTATKLKEETVNMKLFITGNKGREYTKVMAPPTTEGPRPYRKKTTPTLVIRQKGTAWEQPFAVVYEPFTDKEASIVSASKIEQNKKFKGFKVISKIAGNDITQNILIQDDPDSLFADKNMGISFTGRYAVITLNNKQKLQSVYIGQGKELKFKNIKVTSDNYDLMAAYINFKNATPQISANNDISVKIDSQNEIKFKATKTK